MNLYYRDPNCGPFSGPGSEKLVSPLARMRPAADRHGVAMRRRARRHLELLRRPERVLRRLLGGPSALLLSWGDRLTKSELLDRPGGQLLEAILRWRSVRVRPLLRACGDPRVTLSLPLLCLLRPFAAAALARHGFWRRGAGRSAGAGLETREVYRPST